PGAGAVAAAAGPGVGSLEPAAVCGPRPAPAASSSRPAAFSENPPRGLQRKHRRSPLTRQRRPLLSTRELRPTRQRLAAAPGTRARRRGIGARAAPPIPTTDLRTLMTSSSLPTTESPHPAGTTPLPQRRTRFALAMLAAG